MSQKLLLLFLIWLSVSSHTLAQADLTYYLPDGVSYNPDIPTPKSVIGHEVGEFHVSHDRLVSYMYALDKASDRITLEVTGYTHEARPLLLLTITSPTNHQKIESIRTQHVQLTDPSKSGSLDTRAMPAVFYLGCSIHGNEPSGSNAALLMAYHFAAAQGKDIENELENTIILLDPSFNPDGMQRFSSWVNSRKSKSISADPYDMEHNEAWPGGRTNHYWFDLNRDWLVAQQPESQARIKKFHQWKPNVLTDHHEMGTNSTFFFQPGVPARMHPLTPASNLELTKKIAAYHAKALDGIGSFYFTQEGYDDFYYGKGSTFPDVQGAIGILFEQGSSRGHAQESQNGIVTFAFTIRNQFVTALSSLKAITDLRVDLLNHQRQFYKDAVAESGKDPVKAIIFGSKDKARVFHLAEIIAQHQIDLYKPASTQTLNGKTFDVESSFILPMNQSQYRLIKGMFERRNQFTDSLFYDISSWTLSLASGLDHEELKAAPALGPKLSTIPFPTGKLIGEKSEYAYVFEPYGYYTPRALFRLLEKGLRVKVATESFNHPSGKKFERGSILIPVAGQEKPIEMVNFLINEITSKDGIDVYSFNTGLDFSGVSLGSGSFLPVRKPEIAMLVDAGVSANDAGEMWHLLDTRFNIPVTMLPLSILNSGNISRYNTIIFPPGFYNAIGESTKEKLKAWVQAGNVVIGLETALNWLHAAGIGKFDMKVQDTSAPTAKARAYADIEEFNGAQQTDGAIFEANVDLTHPLLYGYYTSKLPIFKSNNIFMQKAAGAYSNPIVMTSNPLLSGYISKANLAKTKDASVVGVTAMGRGRVIGFTENMAFRAFWFGTNRLLMNAIFYGPLINEASSR
ncbi:MAG TPA: M14 family metallopeptidase [Chryseosolibacter sp.]